MKFVQLCAMNTTAMNAPETMMRSSMPRETMPASRRVGLRSIRLSRIGSIPSVSAGGPSMMMLTHSSCNAVYGAAKRYQYYIRHEGRYGYHAGRLNYIQYNPNASCGGSNVYIENRATALLYIYTPYQPNAAALEAGAGEGDSCSSYGNRNFAIIYHSMFGSPRG